VDWLRRPQTRRQASKISHRERSARARTLAALFYAGTMGACQIEVLWCGE
jgi:hypothetical protein